MDFHTHYGYIFLLLCLPDDFLLHAVTDTGSFTFFAYCIFWYSYKYSKYSWLCSETWLSLIFFFKALFGENTPAFSLKLNFPNHWDKTILSTQRDAQWLWGFLVWLITQSKELFLILVGSKKCSRSSFQWFFSWPWTASSHTLCWSALSWRLREDPRWIPSSPFAWLSSLGYSASPTPAGHCGLPLRPASLLNSGRLPALQPCTQLSSSAGCKLGDITVPPSLSPTPQGSLPFVDWVSVF